MHMVDALAITGDEGRSSLRKMCIGDSLLWYVGVAALALMALASPTQFSVVAVLSAIAIYIPLSMLGLPLVAWLVLRQARAAAPAALAPAWPCLLYTSRCV